MRLDRGGKPPGGGGGQLPFLVLPRCLKCIGQAALIRVRVGCRYIMLYSLPDDNLAMPKALL